MARHILECAEPFFAPKLDLEQLRPPRTTARYFEFMQRIGMHSLLIVPLRVHDQAIGQLLLARFRASSPPFEAHDLELAQNLASHAALAISNARLLAEARRETAERKRIAERLRTLVDISREFSAATHDYERLLDVVARRLGELIGDLCAIRAVTEDGQWLESKGAVYHRAPELLAATREVMLSSGQRVGEGLSGRVAATGLAILSAKINPAEFEAAAEAKYRPLLARLAVTSSITLPLRYRGKVVGVANLLRGGQGDPYEEEDLHFAESIAEHAALAIGNARSYAAERAARDAAEQTASALREAEGRFARLSESGLVGIVVSDLSGRVFEANDAVLNLIGY
jgi:GAF domain-containing protein